MKFRNIKTGEIAENIEIVHAKYCKDRSCNDCAFGCWKAIRQNPEESARIMGYEAIEE